MGCPPAPVGSTPPREEHRYRRHGCASLGLLHTRIPAYPRVGFSTTVNADRRPTVPLGDTLTDPYASPFTTTLTANGTAAASRGEWTSADRRARHAALAPCRR